MTLRIFFRKVRTLSNIIKYRLLEKRFGRGKLRYLFYRRKSETLMICFSAFPPREKPIYNYVRGFKDFNMDRLYIGDYWGYRGSYYLYENGKDHPYAQTKALIEHIIEKGKYKTIYTAGTSKGGAAALYYGLLFNVNEVFSGACQYYIGNWLGVEVHRKILEGMMGSNAGLDEIKKLNEIIPDMVRKNYGSTTTVHLVYSKLEHTYQEHIEYLVNDLKAQNINLIEHECFFENHDDVGHYFLPYVKSVIN